MSIDYKTVVSNLKAQQIMREHEKMFKPGNFLRNVRTGVIYQGFDIQLGEALLVDQSGGVTKASWLTDDGKVKNIADGWEVIPLARSA